MGPGPTPELKTGCVSELIRPYASALCGGGGHLHLTWHRLEERVSVVVNISR